MDQQDMSSELKYYLFGYSFLQDSIDRAIIEEQTGKIVPVGVHIQQFPTPCSTMVITLTLFQNLLPGCVTLMLVVIYAFIVERIVLEKEQRLHEYMKVMGLGSWAQYVAFFIEALLVFLAVFAILLVAFYFSGMIVKANYAIIVLFVVLVSTSLITQAFLFSALFTSASMASVCAQIVYILLVVPYLYLEDETKATKKLLWGLVSQVSTSYGLYYMTKWEQEGAGLQFHNWNESPEMQDEFSFQMCMILLAGTSLLHLVLLWYISNVYTGAYGVSKPLYFFVLPSYWLGGSFQLGGESADNGQEDDKSNILAVDHLTLDFYENQVTSFLGRNGAGKTTTMSIICGMIPQTSGDVVIAGRNIRSQMDKIRKSLGFCPQHNILIEKLTVEQHLKFYAAVKGVTGERRKEEVEYYLKSLDLLDKRDVASSKLSGGMKRRLSLAAAFIGGSKIVILDEPTAGVDPYARRQIWSMIIENKEGRTILMSTHYMDEAEILGDRIAIISAGKLKCVGSSLFLKSLFGSSYYLTLELGDSFGAEANSKSTISDRTRSNSSKTGTSSPRLKQIPENVLARIENFVLSHIPESKFKECLGQSLIFTLPRTDSEQLASFFDQLDKPEAKQMGILYYGISETKLEEIFLKTDASKDDAQSAARVSKSDKSAGHVSPKVFRATFHIFWIKFMAVYIKRFHNFRRSFKSAICEILLPVLFVGLAVYGYWKSVNQPLESSRSDEPQPRLLSPWLYGSPNYIFIAKEPSGNRSSAADVLDSMYRSPYVSIGCIKSGQPKIVECKATPKSIAKPKIGIPTINKPTCSCVMDGDKGIFRCPAGSPETPMTLLPTGDYLVDATGVNLENWLMATHEGFYRKRYGGFSIGQHQRGNSSTGSIDWSAAVRNFDQIKNSIRDFLQEINFNTPVIEMLFNNSGRPNATFAHELEKLLNDVNPKDNIKVWFNKLGWLALPIYMNVLNNAILRANLPPGADPSEYGILAYSHPLSDSTPVSPLSHSTTGLAPSGRKKSVEVFVLLAVVIAFGFLFASLVTFIVSETVTTAKHLQLISGLRPFTYWAANLAWDMTNMCLVVVLLMVIFFIFNTVIFVGTFQQFFGAILLFLICGFASFSILYWFTFVFKSPSVALLTLSIGYTMSSIVLTVLISRPDDAELPTKNLFYHVVFIMIPSCGLFMGMNDLASAYGAYSISEGYEDGKHPFAWKLLTMKLCLMTISGVFAFLMLLFFENFNRLTFKMKSSRKRSSGPIEEDEDEDVAKERKFVQSSHSKNCPITVDGLTKEFMPKCCGCCPNCARHSLKAVNQICFSVQKGECFGLLGVNGAGKTTTLDMITGKIMPTSGDAYVCGYSIFGDMNSVRDHLGMCPQFDALNLLLTAREQLTFYAQIKGIPQDDIKVMVDDFIQQLDLKEYADRISSNYSGGNKRKLSVAIAMLGNPDVILLDEPVAGMDPKARRFLWNEVIRMTRQGSSIVLTTHSMEECEALCSRLGIMVQGTFRCIGTPQHLKNKFGGGYSLIIKFGKSNLQALGQFGTDLKKEFPKAELKCHYDLQMEYTFPNQPDMRLASIFRFLTLAKSKYHVEDYSLSQTTLDDVFVNLAAEQHSKE